MKTYDGNIGDTLPENKNLPDKFELFQTNYQEDYNLCKRIEKDFDRISTKFISVHHSILKYKRK